MRITEVDNPVTQADIDQLEVFADRLFAKVGIDVEFTRHFLDRVNDERNIKQITMSELTRLFKQEYKRWGKPIAQLGPDAEAVMKDMATDINLPFALRWDHQNKELDLVAKTVMRKADFKTSNQEFAVEDIKQSGALKVVNNIAMRRDNDPFPIKFDSGKLVYVKPLTARKILRIFDIAPKETIDKFMTYIHTANGFRELAQFANERIKGTVKTVKEEPNEGLKSLFKPNAYSVAAARLHSVLQRKKKEYDAEGKPFRHALGWYASKIAGGYQAHIDTRELVSYYQDNYDAVLSESDLPYITEEAAVKYDPEQLRLKIPANDNVKPKMGQVISLDDARAKAQAQLNSLSPTEKKAANEFIKKNPSLLKRLANVGARATARHGVVTLGSVATGPVAPATAVVLNVALLGWDIVDLGTELWKWSTGKSNAEAPRGNVDAEWDPALQLEIPQYPTTWPMDRTGQVLKKKQAEWEKEFGKTHKHDGQPIEIPAFKPLEIPTTSPAQPEIPTTSPAQPKNPETDNPEVPDSKPSDQPDIEIPQPLNAPPKIAVAPKLPPLEVPSQEIAFQKDAPPVVTTVGGTTPPPSNGNKNNNKKRKKKKDWGSGGDVDYDDPLQRWQKKYGTWEPRSR
jgi:hypothetical protein